MGWWGGGSHCSPGEFLTVFSLLTCPGELDLSGGISFVDQTCPGGSPSAVFVNVSVFIEKFYVAFPLFL